MFKPDAVFRAVHGAPKLLRSRRGSRPVQETVSATNSAGTPWAPTATTMYWRPLTM
jgi:hypothetical protein